MTIPGAMRLMACGIAVAAALDPPLATTRLAPLPIALRTSTGRLVTGNGAANEPGDATTLRTALERAMPGALAINPPTGAEALIVVGPSVSAAAIPDRGSVSFVTRPANPGPLAQVLSVTDPRPVLPGWAGVVAAEVAGHDMTPGSSSAVVLESHGVEVDRIVHRWSRRDERFSSRLSFAPPVAGNFALTVRVLPIEADGARATEPAPARVVAEQRKLKILAFDPRPSWASGFARRALEEDPDFDVVTRVRASRGLEVRTGAAPLALTAAAMDPFDLVLVGAPEELTTTETAALESFAERRGGTVVLMADRKPSGGYTRLLGTDTFEEGLLEKPVRVAASDGTGLRGSEFAYPATLPAGAEPIVTLPQGRGSRAPVVSVPVGAGRIVFSGLLDAWRYRGDDDEAFASFWRSQLGRNAARAPRRLEVTLEPAVAAAGSRVRLRAAVRPSAFDAAGAVVTIPALSARAVNERGGQESIRMWPTSEAGVFEGWFDVARAGRYDVKVEMEGGAAVDSPFVATEAAAHGGPDGDAEQLRTVARATGGVTVAATDLQALVEKLRAQPRGRMADIRYPMRSPWWVVAFVGLLGTEWAVRRRRGLR